MNQHIRITTDQQGNEINLHVFIHVDQHASLVSAEEMHERNVKLQELEDHHKHQRHENTIAIACDAIMQRLGANSPRYWSELSVYGHSRATTTEALRRLEDRNLIFIQDKDKNKQVVHLQPNALDHYQAQSSVPANHRK